VLETATLASPAALGTCIGFGRQRASLEDNKKFSWTRAAIFLC
jgi:hypothetical protein